MVKVNMLISLRIKHFPLAVNVNHARRALAHVMKDLVRNWDGCRLALNGDNRVEVTKLKKLFNLIDNGATLAMRYEYFIIIYLNRPSRHLINVVTRRRLFDLHAETRIFLDQPVTDR